MVRAVAGWSVLALLYAVTIAGAWATLVECFDYNQFCAQSYDSARASVKSVLIVMGLIKSP
jgi:hypothetical protein